MALVVCSLLVLLAVAGTTDVQAQGCTFSVGGVDYDLTPLTGVYSVRFFWLSFA